MDSKFCHFPFLPTYRQCCSIIALPNGQSFLLLSYCPTFFRRHQSDDDESRVAVAAVVKTTKAKYWRRGGGLRTKDTIDKSTSFQF